jgi:hypothetical protein
VLEREKAPIPLELVRLRAIVARARAFRRHHYPYAHPLIVPEKQGKQPVTDAYFDPFDIVDHYRALGGTRQALDLGGSIEMNQGEKDTPEAAEFWTKQSALLSTQQKEELAGCLFERGPY